MTALPMQVLGEMTLTCPKGLGEAVVLLALTAWDFLFTLGAFVLVAILFARGEDRATKAMAWLVLLPIGLAFAYGCARIGFSSSSLSHALSVAGFAFALYCLALWRLARRPRRS